MHADGEAQAAAAAAAGLPAAAAEAALPSLQASDASGVFQHSVGGSPGGGGGGGNALLDTPPPAPCSRAEQNVLSPTPSPSATGPPAAAAGCASRPERRPQLAQGAATMPVQQAAGGGAACLCPRATELQRQVVELIRLHSFVRCLAGSMVLPSALLMLEVAGCHPPVAGGQAGPSGLEWTLAQLLALFVRTGEKAATEGMLLAALWVLESAHSGRRSGATGALARYVKLIGVFHPQTAVLLRSNWPVAFETMRAQLVSCQMRLLTCLRWRVHLNHERDVEPCHSLLFGGETTPAAAAGQPADGSRTAAAAAGAKPAECSRPLAAAPLCSSSRVAAGKVSSRAVAAARQMAEAYQLGAASGAPAGMAGGSRCRGPTLDDLEVLLASNRASLRASVHSMVSTLQEQAAALRRALLHHAAKRGLCRPCGAEPDAKRRRFE